MGRVLARGLRLPARDRERVKPAGHQQEGPAVAAFLQYLVAERGASAHTVRSYRADLVDCASFLERRGLGALPTRTRACCEAYLADLHARPGADVWPAAWPRWPLLPLPGSQGARAGRTRRGGARRPCPAGCRSTCRSTRARRSSVSLWATTRPAGGTGRSWRCSTPAGCGGGARRAGSGRRRPPRRSVAGPGQGSKERIVPWDEGHRGAPCVPGAREGARGALFRNHRGGRLTVRSLHRIVRDRARAAGLAGRVAPHPASHVRDPSARRRRGPPPDPGAPGPRPAGDDAAIHPRERGPAREGVRRGSPRARA